MSRIISASYTPRSGFTPTITYVLRDDKIKRLQEIEADIYPYFYVRKSDFEIVKDICQQKLPFWNDGIISAQPEKDTRLYDTTELAIRVSITNPRNVAKIREILKERGIKLYESDIPFVRRFAYDKGIYSFMEIANHYPVTLNEGSEPRVCWADIETKDDNPETQLKDSVIRCISVVDQNNEWFICEDTETATINKFIATILDYDVVCFWNGDEFDVPILKFRAKEKKIPVEWFRWRFFDTGYFYSRANASERWSLDYVAQKILGEKKIVRDQLIEEMFHKNREKLKEYNVHDARLLMKIDNALQIFQTRKEMADIAGIFVDELLPSTFVDSIIIRESTKRKNRIVFGSRRRKQDLTKEEAEKFIGAAVMTPIPGHFKNVIELDFNALYTSIIRSLNISSETIGHGTIEGIGYVSLTCNPTQENQNPIADVVIFVSEFDNILCSRDVDPNELRIFVRAKDYKAVLDKISIFVKTLPFKVTMKTSEPSFFSATEYGLFPYVLDNLIARRNEYKKLAHETEKKEGKESLAYIKYNTIQNVYKISSNSFHPNTQVFTVDGPVPISQIKVGDKVFSINIKTNEIEIKPVLHIWKHQYSGRLLEFEIYHDIFLKITPEHHLLLSNIKSTNPLSFRKWDDLVCGRYCFPMTKPKVGNLPKQFFFSDYLDNIKLYYKPPFAKQGTRKNFLNKKNINYHTVRHRSGLQKGFWYPIERRNDMYKDGTMIVTTPHSQAVFEGISPSIILQLIGWYVSEGSLYSSKPKKYKNSYRGKSNVINFSNYNKEYRNNIQLLLKELGLHSYSDNKNVTVGCGVLFEFFKKYCGRGSFNKKLPNFIWDLDSDLLFQLFHTLYKGDGTTNRGLYSTVSKQLAHDIFRLSLHLGMRPNIKEEKLPNGNIIYRIGIIGNPITFNKLQDKCDRVRANNYNGNVYECEVSDNHNLLVGGGGPNFVFCGNSVYGSMGSKYGRYYTRPLGESVSVFGQYLAMRAKDVIEKSGYQVLYIDTDGLFIRGPENVNKEELGKIAEDLVQKINEVSDKILEEHGVPKEWRKVSIKLELLLKNIVWFDAKKRYAYSTFEGCPEYCITVDKTMKTCLHGFQFIWKDNQTFGMANRIESVGIETKRSDWSQLSKEVLFETIRKLFKGEAHINIIDYLLKTRDELINGKYNEKLVITKTVRRNLSAYEKEDLHVKAARLLSPRERLLSSRINYVINGMNKKEPTVLPVTNGLPEISQNALKYYYWNRQVFPPTERLLKAIGIQNLEQYLFMEPKRSLAENQSKLGEWK